MKTKLGMVLALAGLMAYGVGCGSAQGNLSLGTPEPEPEPEPAPVVEAPPEPEPEPEVPKVRKEGHVTITDDHLEIDDVVKFETGSAKLKPESFELLDDIVKVMKGHPEIKVLHVVGHTDKRGNQAANMQLSDARAKSVVDYIKSKGVEQPIDARGAGPTEPLCQEESDDCHTKNRRVEFKIEKG